MNQTSCKLTVFFENPFWIGLYELIDNDKVQVCKITFGAEPKDYEVFEFLLRNHKRLRFSPPVYYEAKEKKKINPKRMKRAIQKQLKSPAMSTKSQEALKLQHEACKGKRKEFNKARKEEEKQRKYELRKAKAKEKHKGH